MSQSLELWQAADLLKHAEDVFILTHKNPDGDTLGSGYGLMHALRSLGKRAQVLCHDPIPDRYDYLDRSANSALPQPPDFAPKLIVAVDTADTHLLGDSLQQYVPRVDLCIDHHSSNSGYARRLLLRGEAAANCELMLEVIEAMGVELNSQIADCLYTGLATDTGCFRFSSTTVDSHRAADKLMTAGADVRLIHRRMFESTSRGKIRLTIAALQSLRYELDGRCALMVLPRDCINENGVTDDELEGISAIPREIEGVQVGVTLRQFRNYQGYKISVRTDGLADASAICARLGGGGHEASAGCTVEQTPLEEVIRLVLESVQKELERPNRTLSNPTGSDEGDIFWTES